LQVASGAKPAKDATITLFQNLISRATDFVYIALLARLLVTSELGFFFIFRTIVVLAATTTCLGLPISLTRSVSMHHAAGRFGSLKGTADKGLRYSIISGFLVSSLIFLSGQYIFTGVSPYFDNQLVIQILSFNVFSQILFNNLSAVMIGLRKFATVAAITISSVVLRTIPGVIATSISGRAIDAILWWFIGDFISASLFIIVVIYSVKDYPKNSVSFRELIEISAPLLVSYYINSVYLHLERFAILAISGIGLVAVYSIASTLCTAFTTVYSSFSSGLFPTFSQQYEQGKSPAVLRLSHRVSKLVSLVYFPFVSIGLVGAPYLIFVVYSDLYISAYPLFIILILGTMVASLSTSLSTSALAIGRSKLVMLADSIGFSAFLIFLALASFTSTPLLTIAFARGLMVTLAIVVLYLKLSSVHDKPIDIPSVGLLALIFVVSSAIGLITILIFQNIIGFLVSIPVIIISQILMIRASHLLTLKDVYLFTNLLPTSMRTTVLRIGKTLVIDSENEIPDELTL
jgi:O-antigen/teichoic acid export membrane protein